MQLLCTRNLRLPVVILWSACSNSSSLSNEPVFVSACPENMFNLRQAIKRACTYRMPMCYCTASTTGLVADSASMTFGAACLAPGKAQVLNDLMWCKLTCYCHRIDTIGMAPLGWHSRHCVQIDAIIINCCNFTPIPSLASAVVNRFKLKSTVLSYNFSGMGCAAMVIATGMADELLQVRASQSSCLNCLQADFAACHGAYTCNQAHADICCAPLSTW